jgi:hypothetical protein
MSAVATTIIRVLPDGTLKLCRGPHANGAGTSLYEPLKGVVSGAGAGARGEVASPVARREPARNPIISTNAEITINFAYSRVDFILPSECSPV